MSSEFLSSHFPFDEAGLAARGLSCVYTRSETELSREKRGEREKRGRLSPYDLARPPLVALFSADFSSVARNIAIGPRDRALNDE